MGFRTGGSFKTYKMIYKAGFRGTTLAPWSLGVGFGSGGIFFGNLNNRLRMLKELKKKEKSRGD